MRRESLLFMVVLCFLFVGCGVEPQKRRPVKLGGGSADGIEGCGKRIQISFSHSSEGAVSYLFYYSIDSSKASERVVITEQEAPAQLGDQTVACFDTKVVPETGEGCFFVTAFNGAEESKPSKPVCF